MGQDGASVINRHEEHYKLRNFGAADLAVAFDSLNEARMLRLTFEGTVTSYGRHKTYLAVLEDSCTGPGSRMIDSGIENPKGSQATKICLA